MTHFGRRGLREPVERQSSQFNNESPAISRRPAKTWFKEIAFTIVAIVIATAYFIGRESSQFIAELFDTSWHPPIVRSTTAGRPVVFEDRAALLSLLRSGQFAKLEAHLADLRAKVLTGEAPDTVLEHAYRSFKSADPALWPKLIAWTNAHGKSAAPWLARAMYLHNLSEQFTSTQFGKPLADAERSRYFRYVHHAFSNATRATERDHRLTPAFALSYTIRQAMPRDGSADKYLTLMGFRNTPCSPAMHKAVLWAAAPDVRGSYGAIEDHLRKFHKQCPNLAGLFGFGHFARGMNAFRRGHHERAIEHFDKALAYGEVASYRYWRGGSLRRLGKFNESIAEYRRALKLEPQASHLLNAIAAGYASLGDREKALAHWDKALALSPYDSYILLRRGEFREQLGTTDVTQFVRAELDLKKALKYAGSRKAIHQRIRNLQNRMDNHPNAIVILRKRYYANPMNEWIRERYRSQLSHRFQCARVQEYRAFLWHCEETGACSKHANRYERLELEDKLKRFECPPETATKPKSTKPNATPKKKTPSKPAGPEKGA